MTISSTAGLVGQEFCTAYAASKFGVEGWIESLTPGVAPFGIRTMLVEPGFFRTELLTPESTKYAEPSIDDRAERTKQAVAAWNGMNGQQAGDPTKLANALVQLASQDEPPQRFPAGADAIGTVEQKAKDLLAQAASRELSSNLAHDDAQVTAYLIPSGHPVLRRHRRRQGHGPHARSLTRRPTPQVGLLRAIDARPNGRLPALRGMLHAAHIEKRTTHRGIELTGTAALMSRASSGIGAATGRRLAEHGASVALVARRRTD